MSSRSLVRGASLQGWILLICFVIGAAVCFSQFNRLQRTKSDLDDVKRRVATTEAALKASKENAAAGQVRVAPATKDEEAHFLALFRDIAARNKVAVMRWTAAPELRVRKNPNESAEGPAQATIKAVAVNIELAGSYGAIRSMMDELVKSNRLVVLEEATWERLEEGISSRLTCRIVRFVGPSPLGGEPAGVKLAQRGGSI